MQNFLPEKDTVFTPFFVETFEVLFGGLLRLRMSHSVNWLTVTMIMPMTMPAIGTMLMMSVHIKY